MKLRSGLLAFLLLLAGCGNDPGVGNFPPASSDLSGANPRGRGAAVTSAAQLATVPKSLDAEHLTDDPAVAPKALAKTLPASVVFDPKTLPPVLDQGYLESCGSFGLAYSACGYAASQSNTFDISSPANQISPAFMYKTVLGVENKTAANDSDGTVAHDYYDYLLQNGAASLASVPYPLADPTLSSGAAGKKQARAIDALDLQNAALDSRLTIGQWAYISKYNNLGVLKSNLSNGYPLGILVQLSKNFDNFYNTTAVFKAQGAHNQGGHFMCLVGYDDGRQAFRVQNSWGTDFGDQGFFWWDYTSFLSSISEAHIVYPVKAAPVTASGTSLSVNGGGGAVRGDLISAFQSYNESSGHLHLVLRFHLNEPLRLLSYRIKGPSGKTFRHDHGFFVRSGHVYISRKDGHQWPAGQYQVAFTAARRDGSPVSLSGTARVGLLRTVSLPASEPTEASGSNGQASVLEP